MYRCPRRSTMYFRQRARRRPGRRTRTKRQRLRPLASRRLCDNRTGRIEECAERFRVRGASDATLGEDRSNVARGSNVERWIRGMNVRRDTDALQVCDFGSGTFLNGDVIAVRDGEIESGYGSGDVKRDVVFLGKNGDLISADFVGGVAVGGNPVGSCDDGADIAGLQKVAHHIVGDERKRDAALVEFPGGEARALEIGTCFGNQDVDFLALFEGDADYAKSRADSARGERAGIALSHHMAASRHEFRTKAANGFVSGFFFQV